MESEKKKSRLKKEVSFLGLFGKESLEELQQKLMDAFGISFSIIDYKGEAVTSGEEEPFCGKIRREESCCAECQISRAFAAAKSAIKNCPFLFSCPAGLVHMAVPVVVNNQYLGAVTGGPVRCEDVVVEENITERRKVLEPYLKDRDYTAIPEFSNKRLQAIADMVFLLFKEMGEKETVSMYVGSLEHKEVHLADIRKKNRELQERIENMEYDAMKERLPKQLLLNLLTTISSFSILENARKTEEVIAELSSILRYYLDTSADTVALSEELKQINNYLEILRQQYGQRLDFKIQCQKEVENQNIPVLGLFPFVEHMVDFGIIAGHFQGTMFIDAEKQDNYCKITIQLESSGLALGRFGSGITDSSFMETQTENTRMRFSREYGDDFEMTVNPNVAVFKIPRQDNVKEMR